MPRGNHCTVLMELDKQAADPNSSPSLMAKDRTYGEKRYDFIFKDLLNFWTNLVASAAFSFWAIHSTRPVLGKVPGELHAGLKNWIGELGFMKSAFKGDHIKRSERAGAMANALMLGIPGHVLMIPTVWLGAKIKPAFVRHYDRKHYGEDAEEDPTIAARHAIVDAERKPTLLGATLARVGTMFASEGAAFLIGSGRNFVNTAGEKQNIEMLKKFPGVDPLATEVGDTVGDIASRVAPGGTASINQWFGRRGYQFAADSNAVKTFSRYLSLDVLYTIATAYTIHPIMNLLKYIPGMSYRDEPGAPRSQPAIVLAPAALAEPVQADELKIDQPRHRVAGIINHLALSPPPQFQEKAV